MPRYLKLSISVVLYAFTLGLMGCNDYTPNPEEDIAIFQPFIDANINKKPDDPYISSTVKPGDKLYPFLVSLQHGKYDGDLLEKLVAEYDADAMYWYARSDINNIKRRKENFKLLDQAANKGVPYAAWALSNQSSDCLMYLSSASLGSEVSQGLGKDTSFEKKACSEDYLNLSIKLAKAKAKQGDLRSQYFLLKQLTQDGKLVPLITENQLANSNYYQLNFSKETREHYLKEVIRFAENHYYQPLMDYVDTILTFDRNKNEYVFSSKKLEKLVVQLLTVGVNNNYIPTVELLVALNRSDLNEDDALYQKLNKLGGTEYLASRFYDFEQSYTRKELACYALMFKDMTGNTKFFTWIKNRPSDEELESFNCQSHEKLKEMTPMVYIDGFTSRDKWVD
ncbi:tryptophanase [Vibrio algivorus]|uniref:Sel1 repeat family protein n=1 Tax=Vibrio algivorus TaxID=1667024 RepID=A0ABQ6EP22_9VIBR|nr:tryptophanase [Vibrio algivorus]GLT14657.1 hypothetical protein GCM10007931_16320 [Vibrio algivorus]